MEIKINKEIRTYKESIFFGLSLRQLLCSILAVGVAVLLYFSLVNALGQEMVSWICIVGAAPFAAAGFFKYNGLTIEKFVVAWFKSAILKSGRRVYKSENYYLKALETKERKGRDLLDKIVKTKFAERAGRFFRAKKRTEINPD
ncbi:MAG: PrgI family protein [Oscillospiraceae bacterium]|nr:PrgI family protein [Oscillospiraceae bacterium]